MISSIQLCACLEFEFVAWLLILAGGKDKESDSEDISTLEELSSDDSEDDDSVCGDYALVWVFDDSEGNTKISCDNGTRKKCHLMYNSNSRCSFPTCVMATIL